MHIFNSASDAAEDHKAYTQHNNTTELSVKLSLFVSICLKS